MFFCHLKRFKKGCPLMSDKLRRLVNDSHMDCFGDFRPDDLICKKHCILCIRCLIEKNQNVQMEIFEEMMAAEMMTEMLQ